MIIMFASNLQLSSEASSTRASQIPAPISTGTRVSTAPTLKYATLASFSWDQDNDKVKVNDHIIS